ncbi:RagB/SusD family nutrient uptake outer membrane protein [Fibrella aquatilis]|uniref:RagB/SusD family nutrient uptake outer membrane protein n=1 Tax=Fibrella aquatilis TaxID=2817059 RepID=A0A939G792_9BACT|nr:RagB/SusD family nutrient uptake outer membrane protein [Fibrella aquatilis]MBO0931934.1 RagB/SusD family nutrient uptake outer membrane protein [Fibrella aquatilis]
MKATPKYLYTLLLAAGLSACSDSYLLEEPKSFLSPGTFYKSEKDLDAALSAIYRAPQDRYSNMWAAPHWFEWGTDIQEITSRSQWAHHNAVARLNSTFDATLSIPSDFWNYTYRHVKNINTLLANLGDVPITEARKNQIIGQARAMRGLLYFDGVRVFNGMPLLLVPESESVKLNALKRATPEEMYAAIIADLTFAKDNLPAVWTGANDQGRITSGGAAAMLAKVYLTMAGYPLNQKDKLQQARTLLKEFVVDKKYGVQYGLFDNYGDAFQEENVPGKESVWSINFTRGGFGQGNDIPTNYGPLEIYSTKGLAAGGGWSNGLPTDAFYKSFDQKADKRFKYLFWTSTADIPEEYASMYPTPLVFEKPHIKKFRDKLPVNNAERSGKDHNIIRYADVLLMYSEVLNELGDAGAYTYINQVRKRAGLGDLPTMSQEAFRDAMLLERAWELCFEGDRKMDLVRSGKYAERVKAWNPQAATNVVKGKHEFWPIPQRELDISKSLVQNPGW